MVVGMDAPEGVAVRGGAYLATFTYRVPADASGTFTIEVRYDDTTPTPTERTFLFGKYAGLIDVHATTAAQVTVVQTRNRAGR